MSAAAPLRQPAGTPVGGQFAPGANAAPEPGVTLAVVTPRPDNAVRIDDLGQFVVDLARQQVPDAREIRLEVGTAEEVPFGVPMAARDVPFFDAESLTVVDSRGVEHLLHLPGHRERDYYDIETALDRALRATLEDRDLSDGDVAYLDLAEYDEAAARLATTEPIYFDDPAPF